MKRVESAPDLSRFFILSIVGLSVLVLFDATAIRPVAGLDSTVVTVSCSPSNIVVDQPTTCTATVTDTSVTPSTPTGTVSFTTSGTGAFSSSSCTLVNPTSSSASCSVTYTPTSSGTQVITGTYSGDATHAASVGSTSVTPCLCVTSTTLTCPGSGTVGVAFTCAATVTDTSGGTTPTGSVTFTPGGMCTLVAGVTGSASCSVSITPSAKGALNVFAAYSGDAIHFTSAGSATVNVSGLASTTIVSCPTSGTVGVAFSCSATVTGSGPVPTGAVTFTPGGDCPLVSGSCSVTIVPSAAGTLTVCVSYPGDSTYNRSSVCFNMSIGRRSTSTSVSCSPNSVLNNTSTNCTATVVDTDAGTASTPTGSVSFSSNVTGTFGPCTLATVSSTTASCTSSYVPTSPTVPFLALVTASYPGDSTHLASAGTFTVTECACPLLVSFTSGKLHWTHHLSLAKSSSVQTWTAIVEDNGSTSAFVRVTISGTGDSGIPYVVSAPITMVQTGKSSFTFTTPVSTSLTGLKICFTASLMFGPTSTTVTQTSPITKSGCFAVLA